MKCGLCTALSLVTWLALAAAVRAESGPPAPEPRRAVLQIGYEDGLVTLEARDVPLANVLRALGARVGYRTEIVGDLDRNVDLSMANKPLDAAIRQLVGRLSLVMIMRPPDAVGSEPPVRRIFVYATPGAPAPRVAAGRERPVPQTPDESVAWDAGLPLAQRIAVLDRFALAGGDNAVEKIEQAIANDTEPEIRKVAVQALESIEGQGATLALGRILFGGYDSETQRMAILALATKRSEAARAFLEHVAQDAESENSDLAADLLTRFR